MLEDELGAVCTSEQWTEIYDRLAALARGHRSTIVFVNTRRLVEKVAMHLGERLGAEAVAAHHGSLSRARRFQAEQRLKSGDLKAIVATASLELGIDIGAVDLCCLVGSARSIATGVQRIGRSGHMVGGTPKGRLFPLTRDQLVECASLVRAARRGELDRISLRDAPLDILAQQVVAACAADEWDEDALFALVRRAGPYQELERKSYDEIVEMLSEGIASHRGRNGALVHRDAVNRRLRGRRGARLAAITSGGAIPDTGLYDVVLEPEETVIGTVEEDFAIESMAGDVFLLGNNSWRIRRVENGKVRVEDAQGAAPNIPFWLGEAPARTRELSREVGVLREEIAEQAQQQDPEALLRWLAEACALDQAGARLLRDYVLAGRAALGAVPSETCVIAERFFDEAGGMQLVIHAPFGGRINRAWGMALRKKFCRSFDFELQAAATDDGVILSLGPQHSFPLETIFDLLRAEDVPETLTQAALQAPMFETRWRWNAGRALALLRRRGGKKVPPNLQRMRAQDLLAAVFPGQTACQDNHGGGPIEVPDHPLVNETVRDCLVEATDAEGLQAMLTRLHAGEIRKLARDVAEPSPFSHEIINANPYAFLDDAPLEERRSRAVSVRRGLPAQIVDSLGALDPQAVDNVVAEAQPTVASADELHDLLLDQHAWPEAEGIARGWEAFLDVLIAERRAARAEVQVDRNTGCFWVAAERRSLVTLAWPDARFQPDVVEPPPRKPPPWTDADSAATELVRSRLMVAGPVTAAELAAILALPESTIEGALAQVELSGAVLRGQFVSRQPAGLQWCDRRLLARMNRRTLEQLRREIEPVTAADFIRFLHELAARPPGGAAGGSRGAARGDPAAAGLRGGRWRVGAGDPAGAGGGLRPHLAGRPVPGGRGGVGPVRAAGRGDGDPDPGGAHRPGRPARPRVPARPGATAGDATNLSPKAADVLRYLQAAGASFLEDIVAGGAAAAGRGGGGPVGAGGRRARHRRWLRGPAQPAALGLLAGRRQRPTTLVRQVDAPAGTVGHGQMVAAAVAAGGRGSGGHDRPDRGWSIDRPGRPAGVAGPPVREALGGGVPGSAAPGTAGAAVAGSGPGLPAAGDARGDARRAPGGWLRGRTVRLARGGGVAASDPPQPAQWRGAGAVGVRPAEPGGHHHTGQPHPGDAGQHRGLQGRRPDGRTGHEAVVGEINPYPLPPRPSLSAG